MHPRAVLCPTAGSIGLSPVIEVNDLVSEISLQPRQPVSKNKKKAQYSSLKDCLPDGYKRYNVWAVITTINFLSFS